MKLWSGNTGKWLLCFFRHWRILLFTLWLIQRLLKKIILQSFIRKWRLLILRPLFWLWRNIRTWWLNYLFLYWFDLPILSIKIFWLWFFRLIWHFRISLILKRGETVIWWVGILPFLLLRLVKYFPGWTVSNKTCLTSSGIGQHF